MTVSAILPRKRIGGAKQTYFTPEEIDRLLQAAKAHSTRDWLLIYVTVTHGLRASEAVALTPADIRDGHLWVSRLKGSQRTCQPLTPVERQPLFDACAGLQADGRLFPITRQQFWRIMRARCADAGLSPIAAHPHSLKHSMCRAVLDETGNLQTVKQVAGHSSITSTLVYTRPTDQQAWQDAAPALKWAESENGQ